MRILPITAALTMLSLGAAVAVPSLSVDDVIERHLEARGGYAALHALRTVVYSSGLYREPGYEGSGNAFMALARPYYKVVGDPESPGGFMEGYDGAAWEWFADPGFVIRTVGEAAAASRHGAYLDGALIDYRERGATATLGGTVPIGDRNAYRITLTARDGFGCDYFLDTETYLLIAERKAAPIHAFGEPVSRETRIGDYRRVGGVLFAHRYTETDISSGEMLSEMQWGKIEVGRELPRWWFSPPEFERTPLGELLEHLFFERTDAAAMLWTYEEFRRVHPGIDTEAGVEAIGYHLLKMGNVTQAISLLSANLAHHPDSAAAAFSLGRAQATAGASEAARARFERALALEPGNTRAAKALAALDE